MTTKTKVRLASTESTYTLTSADMDTFNALVQAQGYIGQAQSIVGQPQLWNFFKIINDIAYDHYRLSANAQLKSWMNAVFTVLTNTKTCYQVNGNSLTGVGMYVLYMYYQFNQTCITDYNNLWCCDDCNQKGYPLDSEQRGGKYLYFDSGGAEGNPWWFFASPWDRTWMAPTNPPGFHDAIISNVIWLNQEMANQKGSTTTISVLTDAVKVIFSQVQQFQQSRFDPANWTNSGDFVTALTNSSLWQDQKTMLKTFITNTNMDSDSYLFMLYLIMGLSASNVSDQQMVQKIINTVTGSMEYANDIFMNQLVYLILMQMADPLGHFGYNNAQLKTVLTNLINAIVVSNAATKIISISLQNHVKILNSDASYPMQDPYNPNMGFDTRQTDTIAALDQARATMSL